MAILIGALCLSSYVAADTIYQTSDMPGGKSWADSAYWSGAVPSTSTANDYYVGQGVTADHIVFRTKDNGTAGSSDTFPAGNTLWMGYNTDGTFSTAQGQIGLKSWNFTVNDLRLGNSLINQAMSAGTINLKGSMEVNGTVVFQFGGATDRFINVQSAISGAGEITLVHNANKDNLIISSANNAFTGTLNVSQNSSVVLKGANAMQNASSIVLNSGSTLKLSAAQTFVENSISGTGTLKIAADQSISGISDAFTGTINVTNSARAEYSKPLSSNTKLVIDNGAQFRVFAQNNPVINCDISLAGTGRIIGGKNAGALVFHECSGTSTVNGNISVDAYSMIGSYYIANALFNGEIDTNGYTLEFRQTREGGSGNNSSFTVAGDVLSTGGTLGTLWLAYDVIPSVVDTHLYIGDSTAADENSPTNQIINAKITNANKNEIVIQPGANRTVTVNGTMAHNTNNNNNKKGFIKNGEGTLVLTGGLTTQMAVNAGVFELTGSAFENVTGTITVNDGGTLEYNVASGDEKTAVFTNTAYVLGNGDILKTGEGRLKINTEGVTGDLHFTAENFVVASGRLDLQGYMLGNIEVDANTVFSPGNSVGEATFGGGYILKDGATLLIEQEGDRIDTLTASSFTIDSNSIIDIVADSLHPGASYDIIFQTDSEGNPKIFTEAQATDDFWNNLLTPESAYYWNLSVSGNIVRASVDANAVPEPSTWALLSLGVVVLFLRKRVRN
ncbi:MAG: PEP-CTERM sorting domain-containing protein [Thermoguttaceae bacterium]|nr:PEP-CTERM sorting domain-containing protein [Thermoguttaceae bacterium]